MSAHLSLESLAVIAAVLIVLTAAVCWWGYLHPRKKN